MGGGQGACRSAPGPSAVHVAMSNTLNTPVESLEADLPVRVREVAVRRGSGGAGAMPGGDGIVRRIEALAPLRFSLITERRSSAPAGREGGGSRSIRPQHAQRRTAAGQVRGRALARRRADDRDAGRRRLRSTAQRRLSVRSAPARQCARRHLFAVQPDLL